MTSFHWLPVGALVWATSLLNLTTLPGKLKLCNYIMQNDPGSCACLAMQAIQNPMFQTKLILAAKMFTKAKAIMHAALTDQASSEA